jgi:hypothetical protein
MKYILLILLLLPSSLYSQQSLKQGILLSTDKPVTQIDPALKPYVDRFEYECKIRGVVLNRNIKCVKFPSFKEDSIMRIKDEKPQWIGVNITDNNGNSYVFLNPTFWYYYDDDTRELNVFHELFHAYFNMPHIPDAIMCGKLSITNVNEYKKNRKEILDRMFKYIKIGHYE